MKGVRASHSTLKREAWCLDCGRRWAAPNALAVAARHTAAFQHKTKAQMLTEHTWLPDRNAL